MGNDITFDMRHVARGVATRRDATRRSVRLLEAKFSDGMCREAGPDGYAKGSLRRREGIPGTL